MLRPETVWLNLNNLLAHLLQLLLTTKEKVILFDQKYNCQIDGVAMGSPLGPTLANIFLCHQETMWLKNCLKSFKPVYYKR